MPASSERFSTAAVCSVRRKRSPMRATRWMVPTILIKALVMRRHPTLPRLTQLALLSRGRLSRCSTLST